MNRIGLIFAGAVGLIVLQGCASDTSAPGRPKAIDNYVSGMQSLDSGNEERAVSELETAVQKNPNLIMARMKLGDIYKEKQDYDRALPHYETVSKLDPYTGSNFYNLGFSRQMLEQFREATKDYIRAIELLPEDAPSNMNLGLAYYSLGEMDQAAFYLERASRIDPKNAKVWANIGVVHDARKNATFAEASYKKAIELDPTNQAALQNLLVNQIGQNKANDAVNTGLMLVTQSESAINLKRFGDALALSKKWEDANAAYDKSLAKNPKSTATMNAKAQTLIKWYEADLEVNEKLRDEAVKLWTKSASIDGNQKDVNEALAKWTKK
ncbi:MAG TPA: tetratricopeptide repeat protein [Tepidisphaeraceae bacterium]|nr:tetratricopeptide repeat protein [Tepidisphaeraceae bacterium]